MIYNLRRFFIPQYHHAILYYNPAVGTQCYFLLGKIGLFYFGLNAGNYFTGGIGLIVVILTKPFILR